jgi:tRNA-2-methylthio-N6-dimethylallyladenosine synthase
MQKRLYIETWGCQMNVRQSEGIAGLLEHRGYTLVDELGTADVVLFNGCMVRQKAEEKVYGRIGAVMEQKRCRDVLLGVGGCLGQVRGESLLSRFPAIDFVFGSRDHASIPRWIAHAVEGRGRSARVGTETAIEEIPVHRGSSATAMVTIAEGCSNACSYCIVPYARGPMRSRSCDRVLAEVEEAVGAGYREVLLLGQNVNSYGTDRREYGDFVALLRQVAETGVDRVRFTSCHPQDMTLGVLETMASCPNVCDHLHLACQSGSDRVLRMMRRGYTRDVFLSLVSAAREIVPTINVTTDLIVGYPGETERDVEATMELIERARFGSVFAAKYSPRPVTASASLKDGVSDEVKNERLQRVLERQRCIAFEENQRFVGKDVEVLIEGRTRGGAYFGRATDHRTVLVQGDFVSGDILPVRVEAASAGSLSGAALVAERAGGWR